MLHTTGFCLSWWRVSSSPPTFNRASLSLLVVMILLLSASPSFSNPVYCIDLLFSTTSVEKADKSETNAIQHLVFGDAFSLALQSNGETAPLATFSIARLYASKKAYADYSTVIPLLLLKEKKALISRGLTVFQPGHLASERNSSLLQLPVGVYTRIRCILYRGISDHDHIDPGLASFTSALALPTLILDLATSTG